LRARGVGTARRPRRQLRKKARFALRVNPDVFAETHPYISTGLREHKFAWIFARRWQFTRARPAALA